MAYSNDCFLWIVSWAGCLLRCAIDVDCMFWLSKPILDGECVCTCVFVSYVRVEFWVCFCEMNHCIGETVPPGTRATAAGAGSQHRDVPWQLPCRDSPVSTALSPPENDSWHLQPCSELMRAALRKNDTKKGRSAKCSPFYVDRHTRTHTTDVYPFTGLHGADAPNSIDRGASWLQSLVVCVLCAWLSGVVDAGACLFLWGCAVGLSGVGAHPQTGQVGFFESSALGSGLCEKLPVSLLSSPHFTRAPQSRCYFSACLLNKLLLEMYWRCLTAHKLISDKLYKLW